MLIPIRKINFMTSFFKEVKRPCILEKPQYGSGKIDFTMNVWGGDHCFKKGVYSVSLVPFYARFTAEGVTLKKIRQENWNYGISLRGISGIDEYLKNQFSANGRKVILRNIRRLETSFNIRYELHHGVISEDDYLFLMTSLRSMIERRFGEKEERSKDLKQWGWLQENTLSKIRDKTASLFVIYNEDEPIEISLNYHFGEMLFSSVSSFDTDYSKFGLGQVEIYKQLSWCLENHYSYFEMGVGGMAYKKRWSNEIHAFSHFIFYTDDFLSQAFGYLEGVKILFKEYLKSLKINELIYSIPRLFLKEKSGHQTGVHYALREYSHKEFGPGNGMYENTVSVKNHPFLKRAICEYLYLTQEHISDISILEINPKSRYLIQGKSKVFELFFSP